MTLEALRAQLEAGEIQPAYLVLGEELLLRDDAVKAIREAVLDDGPVDFNYERLEGQATTPADLLTAVGTLPVMGRRRLVVLREPEARRGGKAGPLVEAIVQALAELGDAGDVVLLVVAAKVDGRARWVKAFDKSAVVQCDSPRGARAVEAFVRAEALRQGLAFDSQAATLLAERTGPQLLLLRQEISKVGLFAGPGERVTSAHVAASTSDVAEEPIWDLTDAIGEGRRAGALGVLEKLLRSGGAPPAILGALVTHFRKLLRICGGASVPGPPFAVRKLESQARRFSERRLLACLDAIHQTDLALKGAGGLPPELTLERLVIGLAS